AEPFDVAEGDANHIARYRAPETYDCVHSSHCLEHMRDPPAALAAWWALIKPGGYLVLVVPDEDLYEQGFWPSRFNPDHKATFRLDTPTSWSPVSIELRALVGALPGCRILEATVHDHFYDCALQRRPGDAWRRTVPGLRQLRSLAKRLPWFGHQLRRAVDGWAFRRGVAIDQTGQGALAQIEIIAQKSAA
ncbi:MAG: methyltransferase domain-containing protein, partial [Proteobacteria bacterium]|nr:methyltransferase domain-containing protein [Pseudomonadota bacterium]